MSLLDTFLIRKAPKTGVMTNIEGFVPKEPSKVFGNGLEEFLFVLGTHANPLALRRQLKYAHIHQIHPVRVSMWNTLYLWVEGIMNPLTHGTYVYVELHRG